MKIVSIDLGQSKSVACVFKGEGASGGVAGLAGTQGDRDRGGGPAAADPLLGDAA